METIIQIQVCRGADDRPFITALTANGKVYTSWSMTAIEWQEIKGIPHEKEN